MDSLVSRSRESGITRVVMSVISHGHDQHVAQLMDDLSKLPQSALHAINITHNLQPAATVRNPRPTDPSFLFIERIAETPQGFSRNHNLAFASLDSTLHLCANDWLLVVNPDIRLDTHSFLRLRLSDDHDHGIVAPLVVDAHGRASDAARDLPSPINLMKRHLGQQVASKQPLWFAGMFLAIRVACWRELKGFDEGYFLYCEDVDLCLRARQNGWPIRHETSCLIRHAAQRASRRSLRHLIWHLRSLFRLWTSKPYRAFKAQV